MTIVQARDQAPSMQASEPKLTDWQRGTPPMIGEWNASTCRNPWALRWWDGQQWSAAYFGTDIEEYRRRCRRQKARCHHMGIEYRGLAEKPEGFVAPQPLK